MLKGFGLRNMVMSVALLATGVVSVPQVAMARDHHDRYRSEDYNNSGAYYGSNSGYRSRGYSNSAPYAYGNSSYGYRSSDQYYNGNNGYYYGEPRSAGQSAAIIAGSAGAGAAVGALAGGTKGALIGAAVGGVGGLIYDRTTRNNNNGWGW